MTKALQETYTVMFDSEKEEFLLNLRGVGKPCNRVPVGFGIPPLATKRGELANHGAFPGILHRGLGRARSAAK